MAVSPTPPSISILPPAPLPTDSEDVFDAKAGATLTAQQAMVPEVNAALAWQAGSMAETKGYKEAAATSAGAAYDSATAASNSATAATTNGAAQVNLAKDQVALAVTEKNAAAEHALSSQAYAQASGASAGIPPPVANRFLGTDGAGAVGWVSIPEVPAVAPPSNVTPAASATNITTPSFSGSAYYSLYGKTQASRQARMSLSPIFATVLWDSGEIAGVGTTVTGPSLNGLAPTSTLVYWQIRYKDVDGAWSAWSATTSFTTSVQYVPTVAGTAYGGGFYAGRMKIGADSYALIVAPKASGESASLAVKTSNDSTAGTTSTWNGAANTAAMIAAGAAAHPAASFCKNLTIGGYTDWVLPAKDQLELLYRQLKPDATANNTSYGANPSSDPVGANYTAGAPAQTAIAAFRTGGAEAFAVDSYYWTSTEYSSTYDWIQIFSSGLQGGTTKGGSYRVRAVRMVKI